MTKKVKALVLFSGGLDSLLVIKILEKQGIKTAGICFSSSFFGAEKAKKIAKNNKVKLFVEDFSEDIFGLVKNPKNGLGKNMNPCIDCHSTMFKSARKFADKKGYDFLASGEVIGQRPFSQNKQALEKVIKEAGEEILRPLSAKLLPETQMEKDGLVDRGQLFDFQGRQRRQQLDLAKKIGIKEFESPAGGCLLTDPGFSNRLREALENFPKIKTIDVELLKWGRVFWSKLGSKKRPILAVIGRHREDNEKLLELFSPGDFLLTPKNITGPNVLIRGFGEEVIFDRKEITTKAPVEKPEDSVDQIFKNEIDLFDKIAIMASWYIVKARGKEIEFEVLKKT